MQRWVVLIRDPRGGWLPIGEDSYDSPEAAKALATELVEHDGWNARDVTVRTKYLPGPVKAEPSASADKKRSA